MGKYETEIRDLLANLDTIKDKKIFILSLSMNSFIVSELLEEIFLTDTGYRDE